jgi:hypothetical protein
MFSDNQWMMAVNKQKNRTDLSANKMISTKTHSRNLKRKAMPIGSKG